MRNTLYFLLGAAMIFSLTLQPYTTSASSAVGQQPINIAGVQSQSAILQNYDSRREVSAAQANGLSQMGTAIGAANLAARQQSIQSLRADLSSGPSSNNLWVVMNEAGMPKMMFNPVGTLSFPQAGAPDTIARGFLAAHA